MTTFTVANDSSPGIEVSTWNNVLLESTKHAFCWAGIYGDLLNISAASAQRSKIDAPEYW